MIELYLLEQEKGVEKFRVTNVANGTYTKGSIKAKHLDTVFSNFNFIVKSTKDYSPLVEKLLDCKEREGYPYFNAFEILNSKKLKEKKKSTNFKLKVYEVALYASKKLKN